MQLPEVFCHLPNLPPIDTCFVEQAAQAVYQWPSIDYPTVLEIPQPYTLKQAGVETQHVHNMKILTIPTPAAVQSGQTVEGQRHGSYSRTIRAAAAFEQTRFGQELTRALGAVKSGYLYNPPWSAYDWHRDLSQHECAINFVLTPTTGARMMYRFPTNCRLNYQIQLLDYQTYRPVLIKSKVEHCIINLTDQHRYVLTVCPLESDYKTTKEWLLNYPADTVSYL